MRRQRLSSVAIRRTRTALNFRRVALSNAAFFATDPRLDMQSFSKSCAVIGAVVLGACGSPAELDDGMFPELESTGYNNTTGTGGSGSTVVLPNGGSAGSGSTPVQTGGGAAGTQPVATNGGSSSSGGCPPDVTTLFSRPIAQGGCTSGGGCHEAASPIKPDLVSPNVVARLLNVASSCTKTSDGMSVQPRPYISKDDSFLQEKIAGTPNSACGFSMPFFMPDALSAADEQCIIQWIDQVAGG
jgi:hypothetical protein